MGSVCPRGCDPVHAVPMPSWWDTLTPGAPAREKFAAPELHKTQYLIPGAGGVAAVAALAAGTISGGILLLVASAGVGGWMMSKRSKTEAALAEWKRSKYCHGCGRAFIPSLLAEQ